MYFDLQDKTNPVHRVNLVKKKKAELLRLPLSKEWPRQRGIKLLVIPAQAGIYEDWPTFNLPQLRELIINCSLAVSVQ
jgi:hypothetical protein